MVIALLALLGSLLALYLTLYKLGIIGQLVCQMGSCETVNTSRWSTFLGLPVAAWGFLTYAVLLGLALFGLQESRDRTPAVSMALVAISGWSVLFSSWLTYLELFVIHAICMYCVTSAFLMVMIFATSLVDLRTVREDG
jgi:uncharacterized membrane protein